MNPDTLKSLLPHRRRFLAFLTPRAGSVEAAEELLQTALLKGMESQHELRHEQNAVAWFYRLLRNTLIDGYRREEREGRALRHLAGERPLSTQDLDELERTVCACVLSLSATLKPDYADIIRLVDLEGWDLARFAQASGITPNNAKVRLHRARQALGIRLKQSCGPTCCQRGCADCPCE